MADDRTNSKSIIASIQLENLPIEDVMEILEKLPLSSIVRCRILSKWISMIMDDHHFSSKQYSFNAAKNNPFLFLSRENSIYFLDLDSSSPSEFKKFDIPFELPDFYMIGSCKGYLCLSSSSIPGNSRYQRSYPFGSLYDDVTFVWNPFTKHFMELPSSSRHLSWAFGFGFHPSTKEYKVVKMYDGVCCMRILTLGTDDWRTLKMPSNLAPRAMLRTKNKGVCVNGKVHWIVRKREEQEAVKMVILALDLATEELEEISLPKELESGCCQNLIEIRGCLATVPMRRRCLEIWVLEGSWTLRFAIKNYRERLDEQLMMKKNQGELILTDELPLNPDDVVCFLKDDKLLIQFKIGGVLCYDFRNEVFTDFKVCGIPNLRGISYEYETIALTGSLIRIN